MKKLIAKVFGVELYANAQNIRGRKSCGYEDITGFRFWRSDQNTTPEAMN